MELEKLTLSKTKCHNIHMGKNRRLCPNLQVHGGHMKESKCEKYLGDIIHNTGSIKPNLARRLSRGWGRVNEILAIVKEAPLGRKRIEAGLLLRKSLLINATMFNSEAWHGLSKSQIVAFKKIQISNKETFPNVCERYRIKIPISKQCIIQCNLDKKCVNYDCLLSQYPRPSI